jgi:hypothetical protein
MQFDAKVWGDALRMTGKMDMPAQQESSRTLR